MTTTTCTYCSHDGLPCSAASAKGYLCTREARHAGHHAACDDEDHPVAAWSRRALGAYERHETDDMDGGVAAALIEKEAEDTLSLVQQQRDQATARAEKAEQERDEALYQRDQWMRANDSTRDILDEAIEERRRIARALDLPENATADAMVKHAAESRPLTPDAITDEMVERAGGTYVNALRNRGYIASMKDSHTREVFREALTAALTEPPARPEGAEDIEAIIREEWSFSDEDGGEEAFADLAERLAKRGVRVVGGEDPR